MAMINITELRDYYIQYQANTIIIKRSVQGFIEYVRAEQAKNKRAGVVSYESREATRRLKEIKENQEKYRPLSPEEDFKNIKN